MCFTREINVKSSNNTVIYVNDLDFTVKYLHKHSLIKVKFMHLE